nr:hypothetical protein [Staphylococcus epidermidis]
MSDAHKGLVSALENPSPT